MLVFWFYGFISFEAIYSRIFFVPNPDEEETDENYPDEMMADKWSDIEWKSFFLVVIRFQQTLSALSLYVFTVLLFRYELLL